MIVPLYRNEKPLSIVGGGQSKAAFITV